jgi:hypothetical protein
MYQNLVEGRAVPRSLLVKDMPASRHQDIDFIVDQLDWEKNCDPRFKDNHYLEPVTASRGDGFHDRWICYGKVDGFQYFSAKELTVDPGATVTITDRGAYSLIVVQGGGKANRMTLDCPSLLRFNELTHDEFFCTEAAALAGVTFTNTSDTEPLVMLRYFGPATNPDAPVVGAYRQAAR